MIKFIFFDVGGVLLKDFTGTGKWLELQKELGIMPEQETDFIDLYDKYEPEVCLGRDVDSLLPLIEKKFGVKIPQGYSFLKDGFVNRFEKNESIWPVVEEIQQKYPVGLLTNMYPGMLEAIKEKGLLPNANWAAVIDSSIDKVKKPDKGIFELAEKRAGFSGQEILFVENGAKHVKAASEFGWQTFLYDSKDYEKSSRELSQLLNH
jgi:HAD superfamily hydrolase (TIGR01509 family)